MRVFSKFCVFECTVLMGFNPAIEIINETKIIHIVIAFQGSGMSSPAAAAAAGGGGSSAVHPSTSPPSVAAGASCMYTTYVNAYV